MTLTKYRLGDLIEQVNTRNKDVDNRYNVDDVRGISTGKMFIETKANIKNVSLNSYKVVNPNNFAYVADTSRRGNKISLAFNNCSNAFLVSSISTIFQVSNNDLLEPVYLFMYFNRSEFDRFSRFNSWGSARETFSWEDFCDIKIDLPPLDIQKKYVAIYKAMLENQAAYEKGLEDLLIVANSFLDKLKKQTDIIRPLGLYIEKNNTMNNNQYGKKNVRGISNQKVFMDTKANLSNKNFANFIIIKQNYFAYNPRTDGRDMLVLAINDSNEDIIVTRNYNSFKIKDEKINELSPMFLYSFLNRDEFDRRVRFMSWGSSQELFSWDSLCEIKIPVPDKKIQDSLVSIYKVYTDRKEINEKLKERLKNICPILIKGAVEEAKGKEA